MSGTIFLLQFAAVPGFGDEHYAGKAFLWCVAFSLLVVLFLAWRKEANLHRFSLVGGLLLWGWFLVGALTAARVELTALTFCGLLGTALLFWWLATDLFHRDQALPGLFLRTVLAAAVLGAALGLLQFLHFKVSGPGESPLIPYLLLETATQRVTGPFGQPNLFALLLCSGLLVLCFFYLRSGPLHILKTVVFQLGFLFLGVVLFLTGSRTALLGLGVTFAILIWAYARGSVSKNGSKAPWKKLAAMLTAMGLAFLLAKGGQSWAPREAASIHDTAVSEFEVNRVSDPLLGSSMGARYLYWTASILMAADHPLLGVGLHNFRFRYSDYLDPAHERLPFVLDQSRTPSSWSHNELFQLFAEGGYPAGLIALGLLGLYLCVLIRVVREGADQENLLFLFCHLFPLPFIVQSMFSWPLRYLPLLVLFCAYLGLLCSRYPLTTIRITPLGQVVGVAIAVASLGAAGWLFRIENRIGEFRDQFLATDNLEETIDQFQRLADHPYAWDQVLRNALPPYVLYVQENRRPDLAKKILPAAERLTDIEGSYAQWYNLALLAGTAGDTRLAHRAVARAIDLRPTFQPAWQYQHYLNLQEAARRTGQSLQELIRLNQGPSRSLKEIMGEHPFPARGQ